MAIARNRKKEPDVAAIAAFGAAAEVRNDQALPTPATTPVAQEDPRGRTATKVPSEDKIDGPKASLVRWAGEKELRDDLLAYGKRNRYNMQELMIETMRRGLAELRASES